MAIITEHLSLRDLRLDDAARIALLAGDFDVARMSGVIPHPYSERQAADWLHEVAAGEEGVVFGIERDGLLIGCTGYRARDADHAEIGYWIGKPYWGRGYATEAVKALIVHGFECGHFSFLAAGHFTENAASARVLEKLSFVMVGEEMRECVARGEVLPCRIYRLHRPDCPTVGLSGWADRGIGV